ncbi:hypothetical protein BJ878DRAFT_396497, partial [Calycina marina]
SVYTRLDHREFRLLVPLPSKSSTSPIECRLRIVSPEGGLQYEALSYVEGDVAKIGTVASNGQRASVSLPLENYLRQLSTGPQEVDALCINQAELRETQHQVFIMVSIYSHASNIITWLGAELDFSRLAMEYICGFEDIPDSAQSVTSNLFSMSTATLFLRPWFCRF